MKEFGELLAQRGIGGYYRYTYSAVNNEPLVTGPFPSKEEANPQGDARIYFTPTEVKFHFIKPKGANEPNY